MILVDSLPTEKASEHLISILRKVNEPDRPALGTSAQAQEVISNPGRCAQFYPNANCQNLGPGNPYTGSYQAGQWDSYNQMDHHMRHWRCHHRYMR
jgi:hypothetical protein